MIFDLRARINDFRFFAVDVSRPEQKVNKIQDNTKHH